MPFTLAHAITALPLWYTSRKRLNLLGLMVGAIVPDLAYFLNLAPMGSDRHTWLGAVTYGPIEGLLLVGVIRYVMLYPLRAILPTAIAQRCPIDTRRSSFSVAYGMILALSIMLGALSHIFWDGFSHQTGWAVQQIDWLQSDLGGLPVYKLVQYLSGLFGLVGLVVWAGFRLRQSPPVHTVVTLPVRRKLIVWVGIAMVSLLFGYLAIVIHASALDTMSMLVVRAVIGAVSGSFVGMLMYAIVAQIFVKNRIC